MTMNLGVSMSLKVLVTFGQFLVAFTTAQSLVSDQKLQDAVTIDRLLAHAQALEDIAYATPDRNRVVTSLGHNNTIKYIKDQLEALEGYYDVVLQPFNKTLQLSGNASLVVNRINYTAEAIEYSGSTSLEDKTVVPVANQGCSATDFPETVAGSIALISRGTCSFRTKATLAKEAGSLAALIYNNQEGPFQGTFQRIVDTLAPSLALSQADGLALLAAAGNGTTLLATLSISAEFGPGFSNNVIATTTYPTDTTDILFLGAHSDSVDAGPGINDNGSGTAGILEAAIQLARGGYTGVPTIKFGWWTDEESGLMGSSAYVTSYASAEELGRVRLYLNFDSIASPNYNLGILDGDGSDFPGASPGPAGSGEAEAELAAWFEAQGHNHNASELRGNSDYGSFMDAGIPCGGLAAGAYEIKTEREAALFGGTAGAPLDANYHTPADNMTNLSPVAFEIMGKAIAHAVAYYGANGFDGFPLRNSSVQLASRSDTDGRPKIYKGSKPIM